MALQPTGGSAAGSAAGPISLGLGDGLQFQGASFRSASGGPIGERYKRPRALEPFASPESFEDLQGTLNELVIASNSMLTSLKASQNLNEHAAAMLNPASLDSQLSHLDAGVKKVFNSWSSSTRKLYDQLATQTELADKYNKLERDG